MGHHHITEVQQEKFEFTSKSKMILAIVFVVGVVLSGIGVMNLKNDDAHGEEATEQVADDHDAVAGEHSADEAHAAAEDHSSTTASPEHAPLWAKRFFANLLLNSWYFLLFAGGMLFFWTVNYVANAGWATLVKRVVESITAWIPFGFISILAVLIYGGDALYHWRQYYALGLEPGMVGYDHWLAGKTWFLNDKMFFGGTTVIIGGWYLFRFLLRRLSLKEDVEGGSRFFTKSIGISAGAIAFYAVTVSVLTWLVIMSLEPHWFSTIFSVYNFIVAFVGGLSVLALLVLYLKSKGYMEAVSDEVVHDIGKFMFAFSIFWGYIFVSQFLLIWYANLPEETVYFELRQNPHFRPLFLTNIIVCFVSPFLVLMMRNAKRSPRILMLGACLILVGHWLDVYLMVMPGTLGNDAGFGLLEIGMTMSFIGLFTYVVLNSLSKAPLYPNNHPYLLESANHDVGV
jgi:hypothetical protein